MLIGGLYVGIVGRIKSIYPNSTKYDVYFPIIDLMIVMEESQLEAESYVILPDYLPEIKRTSIKIEKINNIMEENNMELLDLWKERKFFKIENNYQLEKQKIIKEDEAQKIMQEMLNQINVVLDRNEENEFKLKCDDLLTKTTKQKINELEVNKDFSKDKIFDTYQEVKAMLSMTNDYSEQVKILKNYGIIDKKNNKLNV